MKDPVKLHQEKEEYNWLGNNTYKDFICQNSLSCSFVKNDNSEQEAHHSFLILRSWKQQYSLDLSITYLVFMIYDSDWDSFRSNKKKN